MTKGLGRRIVAGLGAVLAVCLGVRLGAWLVGPELPLLGILGVCAAVVLVALGRR